MVLAVGMEWTYSSMLSHWPRPQAAADAINDIFCLISSLPEPQLSPASSHNLTLQEDCTSSAEPLTVHCVHVLPIKE